MKKILCVILCAMVFMVGCMSSEFSLDCCKYVVIYHNGQQYKLSKQESKQVVEDFSKLIEDGYEMPAFGVALNNEVEQQKNVKTFVEFCFDDIYEHNDMPFCKLLVEVESEFCGFNIIRYNDAQYGGRCFYINLKDKTMAGFYENVVNLVCQNEKIVS
ncbi:MAG: hypothetical protein IJA69_05320 [Clostridia bacterium]|nr:hypothetical protein [Clostridia bacterium]